ncbi:MAG: hypothetical protein UH084_06270, partial [Paludibacteraceae bacterium]|nr:hypothetical protein [Paludibacteraceae bacterium]
CVTARVAPFYVCAYPPSGDLSGAALGVRSVALLHTKTHSLRSFTKKPKTFLIYDVPSTIFDYIAYLKETEIKTELFKLNYLICIIQIK